MFLYNITYKDSQLTGVYNRSCHIKADNLTELSLKFNELHPTGTVIGLVLID